MLKTESKHKGIYSVELRLHKIENYSDRKHNGLNRMKKREAAKALKDTLGDVGDVVNLDCDSSC